MPSTHEPTPEFQRFLEWQVESALRRRERFNEPVRLVARFSPGVVAVAFAAMLVGAGGVAASGRIQANQERRQLLEQQQAELMLVQMQAVAAEKRFAELKTSVESGLSSRDVLDEANRDYKVVLLKLQRAQLNIEEVRGSGKPVQDDVTSPLVASRDFVAERLQLDRREAALSAGAAEQALKNVKTRHEVGVSTDVELLEAEARMARALAALKAVQATVDLRQQFLRGTVNAAQATRERLLLATRQQLEAAEVDLRLASTRYAWLKDRFKVGVVGEVEVLKAQLEFLTRQQDLATLKARLAALEQGRLEEPR